MKRNKEEFPRINTDVTANVLGWLKEEARRRGSRSLHSWTIGQVICDMVEERIQANGTTAEIEPVPTPRRRPKRKTVGS